MVKLWATIRNAASGNVNGFVFDPVIDEFQAFDLNALVTIPTGWYISEASDINDQMRIAAKLEEVNGTGAVACIIDMAQPYGSRLISLPDVGSEPRNLKINNDSDVIFGIETANNNIRDIYHFNPGPDFQNSGDDTFEVLPFRTWGTWDLSSSNGITPGYIAGKLGDLATQSSGESFRYKLGDPTFEILSDLSGASPISRVNDNGVIVGKMEVPWRRNKTIPMAFRYDDRNPDPLETFDISSTRPQSLNNEGDFTISSASRLYFYHEGSGFFDMNENALVGDPELIDAWANKPFVFIKDISERGAATWPTAPDFPVMCGYFGFSEIAVVLIPVPLEPTPGITVTPYEGLVTTESGGADTFEVVLNTQPTADVTIGIGSSDTTEGTVNVSSLTYTPADWDDPQTVTVTGENDPDIDGDIGYTIITASATSADPDYNGLDADDVSVTNQDDEEAPSTTYNSQDTPLEIPDNDQAGVLSSILVNDDFQIANLTVSLDISHPRLSDLTAYLIGPDNTQVQLSNLSGVNSVSAFNGTSTLGLWSLLVIDDRKKKTGTLNSWSITVEY